MDACRGGVTRASRTVTAEEVVERAEQYLRTVDGAAVPVSVLCRAVGRSERGLRSAFQQVRGMSPKRYMLLQRLRSVRSALTDAGDRPTTVTSIAIHHGFIELGRFATTYRQAFGETPSETLRGRRRHLAPRR